MLQETLIYQEKQHTKNERGDQSVVQCKEIEISSLVIMRASRGLLQKGIYHFCQKDLKAVFC